MRRLSRLLKATLAVTAGLALLAGCAKPLAPSVGTAKAGALAARSDVAERFPTGFMWGVATAGHQVEGGDTTSNWAKWEAAGRVKQPIGSAVDHWNRYEEDLDLAKSLGLNSYRLSLEWAKIEPEKGRFDAQAIQHYHDELKAIRARGMAPIVTIVHFTYPSWLDMPDGRGQAGWESEQMPVEFARFAGWAAAEYGDDVEYWLTLNEPNTYAMVGYLAGMMPPGRRNPLAYNRVMNQQVKAHKLGFDAIHAADPDAKVSINPIVIHMRPQDTRYKAEEDMTLKAGFPLDETDFLDNFMPAGTAAGKPPAPGDKRYLDFTAFNYFYGVKLLELNTISQYGKWPIYPEGMYEVSKKLYARYKLPLMVTENGMPTLADNPRTDGWTREAYLVHHLSHLRKAMAEGVPVLGYMHWTLVDNYEWGSYEPKFGLFGIDRRDPTLRRFRTGSADVYEAIASGNQLPQALLDRYDGRRN